MIWLDGPMRNRAYTQLLVSIWLGCIFAGMCAFAQKTAVIKGENVSLRATPDKNGKTLGSLKLFEPVTVLDRKSGEFAHIKTKSGQEGYVAARYASKVGFVSTNDNLVHVYRGPDSSYAIILDY